MDSDIERLARIGRTLSRRARFRNPALPSLLLVTDPVRVPEPEILAARLPRGSGVLYRAFGEPGAAARVARLSAIARRRGLVLLVGADETLAGPADGLHLPERAVSALPRLRARRPGWLLTVAAHSPRALRRAAAMGADAALLSTVFESRSPSAGRPMGPVRFAALVRAAGLPVYALGGVDTKTAPRLLGSGAAGLAAVEGLKGPRT